MIFSEQVKQKLYAYFTERWGMWDYTRGWLKSNCPLCGKEKKFGVQIEDNKAHCFSCEFNEDLFKTIIELENLKTYNDVYKTLNTYTGGNYTPSADRVEPSQQRNLQLPADFKLIGLYDSRTAKIVEANLRGRGFNIRKLMRAGIGYCAKGKYAGRIIIPYYENGNLIYFNARKFIDIGEKFKNPTKEECGVGKTEVIYNVDALSLYDRVFVFESTTNCLTIGSNTIGTGGKTLSPKQKSRILQSSVKDLIIGLDDDAYVQALKLGMEFAEHKRVKVLKFPPKQDANVLGKKATLELARNTPWQNYNELFKIYLNEKRAINSY